MARNVNIHTRRQCVDGSPQSTLEATWMCIEAEIQRKKEKKKEKRKGKKPCRIMVGCVEANSRKSRQAREEKQNVVEKETGSLMIYTGDAQEGKRGKQKDSRRRRGD